jgi:hypothetical protein
MMHRLLSHLKMLRCREHSSCSFKDRMTLKIQCCNLLSKGVMSDNTAVYPLPPCHYPKTNACPEIPHDTTNKLMKQQTHTKISAVNGYCLSQEKGKLIAGNHQLLLTNHNLQPSSCKCLTANFS